MMVFFIAGGVTLITLAGEKDPTFIDTQQFKSFNDTFNQQANILTQVDSMKTSITDAKPDFGVFGVLNGLIQTAWNVLQTMFTSFNFFTDIFANLGTAIGLEIPSWVGSLITSLILVTLVFAIFAAIFQRNV